MRVAQATWTIFLGVYTFFSWNLCCIDACWETLWSSLLTPQAHVSQPNWWKRTHKVRDSSDKQVVVRSLYLDDQIKVAQIIIRACRSVCSNYCFSIHPAPKWTQVLQRKVQVNSSCKVLDRANYLISFGKSYTVIYSSSEHNQCPWLL